MDKLAMLVLMAWSQSLNPSSMLQVIAPRSVPPLVAATFRVQAKQGEHPWETRLRQVEIDNIRSKAFAEQATKEAKEIIKNRTDRLEEVERKLRKLESDSAERIDPTSKADNAVDVAAVAESKADKAVDIAAEVRNALWAGIGGSAGLTTLVGSLIWYLKNRDNRQLRKELVEAEALPRSAAPDAVVVIQRKDDSVPLNDRTGLLDLRNL